MTGKYLKIPTFRHSRIISRIHSVKKFSHLGHCENTPQMDQDERKLRAFLALKAFDRRGGSMDCNETKTELCTCEPIVGGPESIGNKGNASPWDKIDYIGAVCFTGNWERYCLLVNELNRVGITEYHITWSFPSPYRDLLFKHVPHIPDMDKRPGYFGATMGQYIALKNAYELGARTALLLEDDCRFLKDLDLLKETMSSLPPDWDILMLDNFDDKYFTKKKTSGWSLSAASHSTACYIVNRRAMKRLISLYESAITDRKTPLRNCDHWTDVRLLGAELKMYCATPNLSLQCYCPGKTNGGRDYMQRRYLQKGLPLAKYEGYGKEVSVLYCVNGDARARKWMDYSIDSLKQMYGKARSLRIFVASDSPYIRQGVTFIDAKPYISKYKLDDICKVKKHGRTPSPMQVFRLAAPCIKELENLDKILYIDIDTEITGTGLSWLFEDDFDSDVKALYEHSKHGAESSRIMLADTELTKMMSDSTISRLKAGGYFNSGVMLMNLAHIRKRYPKWSEMLPSVIDMAVRHHRIVIDQDIINVVFDALPLPAVFNVMPDTDVRIPDRPPVIVHYANTSKYKVSTYPPPSVRSHIIK